MAHNFRSFSSKSNLRPKLLILAKRDSTPAPANICPAPPLSYLNFSGWLPHYQEDDSSRERVTDSKVWKGKKTETKRRQKKRTHHFLSGHSFFISIIAFKKHTKAFKAEGSALAARLQDSTMKSYGSSTVHPLSATVWHKWTTLRYSTILIHFFVYAAVTVT